MAEEENRTGRRQVSVSLKDTLPKIKSWTPGDKAQLSVAFARAFPLQKLYGKTPDALESIVEGFAWVLGPYPVASVVAALAEYVRNHPDLPTPSDLRAMIDPIKEEWKPDWEVYKTLREVRESGGEYALSQEESEYIQACHQWSLGRYKSR